MYEFAKCKIDWHDPSRQGWYLIVQPVDLDTMMDLHKGVTSLYYFKYNMDPHLQVSGPHNPLYLAAMWYETATKFLLNGKAIVVNPSGGMLELTDVEVLETRKSEDMVWPELLEGEIITISRWPGGRHWYVTSNQGRIFSPPKFNQYSDAMGAAKRYSEHVVTKEN